MRCFTKDLPRFLKDAEKIGFLGFGKSNRAVFEFLKERLCFDAVVREERAVPQNLPEGCRLLSGEQFLEFRGEDIIFVSPSVRRTRRGVAELLSRTRHVSSDAELFFALTDSPVLAVSGSDGKSTTVKMAEAILGVDGALACGNVGLPFVKALSAAKKQLVTEISSFTLEYTSPRSRRALITNITENHLDWHGSFEAYTAAKENLIKHTDEAILSPDTEACVPLIRKYKPWGIFSSKERFSELRRKYPFSDSFFTLEDGYISKNGEALIAVSKLSKKEPHNIQNALAAIALTHGLLNTGRGVDALSSFSGLSHRMEAIASPEGVCYVDSSIDSTPKRTAATLLCMPRAVTVLLGGRGKGLSYEPLVTPLLEKTGDIIIFGENRGEIYETLAKYSLLRRRIALAETLACAVKIAKERARTGDTVLLSPASTSYDAFSDFEERGNKFKEYINSEG
ncbi:MAG: UDP-N-acetylmuramoyl-L-alanine--D-glutamate ligase [Clostridia bacterium]|nr:UDP-N-acetylmuramoyl-L-alanine--D-glutamate ligase [Clostridia bacterium]